MYERTCFSQIPRFILDFFFTSLYLGDDRPAVLVPSKVPLAPHGGVASGVVNTRALLGFAKHKLNIIFNVLFVTPMSSAVGVLPAFGIPTTPLPVHVALLAWIAPELPSAGAELEK